MDKPQIIIHVQKSINYTIFDTKWIPHSTKFVCLGSTPRNTGALQIYELSDGDLQMIHQTETGKSLKCGTFGASAIQTRHLATGDFDGRLQLWDLQKTDLPLISIKAHKEIINSIDGIGGINIGEGAPEVVTGSRDGTVKVWDFRQKTAPVAVMEPESSETRRDCWAVTFGNAYSLEERCICAGYDNGDIKMFDLKTMSVLWETNIKNGVCSLEFDRKDILMNKLVASSLESTLFVYDLRTKHPKQGFASVSEKAHKSTIWSVRHTPQNRDLFMSCGGSGTLCLWQYKYPSHRSKKNTEGQEVGISGSLNLLQNCVISGQPINCFDWSPDKLGLCVCGSFDQTVRLVIVTRLNYYN